MWPITSVRCEWFSFSCRLRSARAPSGGPADVDGAVIGGTIAGDAAGFGLSVGAATTGGKMVGGAAGGGLIATAVVWGIADGTVFSGAIAGDDTAAAGFIAGAVTTGGTMVGVALVGGGGFGGGAADGGVIEVAVGWSIFLGTRTDFLHRLQSKLFTEALASRTSGAEQCGQSK